MNPFWPAPDAEVVVEKKVVDGFALTTYVEKVYRATSGAVA